MNDPEITLATATRVAWHTFVREIRPLLDFLPDAQLETLLERLRGDVDDGRGAGALPKGDEWWSLPADLHGSRALLRHDIATLLQRRRGLPEWLYPHDLLPAAPDDIGALP